jgi:hypothetical protein
VLLRFSCTAPRSTAIDPFLRLTAIDPFEIDKQTEQERDEVKDPEVTIMNQHFCICQRLQKSVILGSARLDASNIWLVRCSEVEHHT